jgi:ABC-type Fe3+-hydroxamate transport system substrate-binding protein
VHPKARVGAVAKIGGTKTVSLDKVEALQPTHVIVNVDENRKQDVDAIACMGCQVVVAHPIAPTDNLSLYRLLGGIFHRDQAANRLCQVFDDAYRTLLEAAKQYPQRRVLYLIWRNPWMTISEDTYISKTLALAHLATAGGDPRVRYPEVDFEDVSLDGVDTVLLSSEPFPFKDKHADEVRSLTAKWSPPVSFIDAEMVSWYGSRAIPGLRYLQAFASGLN